MDNEFVSVSYDDVSNSIITIWKKPVTTEIYREVFGVMLKEQIDLGAEAYISDVYQLGIISKESRLWLQNEILPKAYKGGLRKVATIAPGDVFSRLHIENIKNGVFTNAFNIEFRYFQDLSSAQKWVLNEKLPV